MRLIERRIGIEQLRQDRDHAQGIARPAETQRWESTDGDREVIGIWWQEHEGAKF